MRRSLASGLAFVASLLQSTPASAMCQGGSLEVVGLNRVRPAVIDEILPRGDTCLDARERAEVLRRLWALSIFDEVEVQQRGATLHVRVREKWTFIPGGDASVGRSLRDSYFQLSAQESNLLGRAQSLYASGSYSERQLNGEAWWWEHEQAARRVTFEAGAHHYGSSLFFEDSPLAWTRSRSGARLGLRLPFAYGSRWRLAMTAAGYRETSDGSLHPRVATEGMFTGVTSRVTWDGYSWHDLAPSGLRVETELTQGAFFTPDGLRNRVSFATQATSAIRINAAVAVVARTVVEAANPGDPNHTYLLGNIRGVRGLPDNLYRDAAHGFTNVELRFAAPLVARWFLQGVVFADAAVYARMNERGATQAPLGVLGVGVGVRVVPTAFAGVVPRVDIGSLVAPEPSRFVSLGVSQYF